MHQGPGIRELGELAGLVGQDLQLDALVLDRHVDLETDHRMGLVGIGLDHQQQIALLNVEDGGRGCGGTEAAGEPSVKRGMGVTG